MINTDLMPTIDTIRVARADQLDRARMLEIVNAVTNRGRNIFVDANRLAEGLFGTHMAANIFLTGVAYQGGLIPISLRAIEQAIELNGVEVGQEPASLSVGPQVLRGRRLGRIPTDSGDGARRFRLPQHSTASPNCAPIRTKPTRRNTATSSTKIHPPELREVVARYLYKLMAYKDEYEVARLLTKPEFEAQTRDMWEAPESISYNLHPPLLRHFGVKKKLSLGAWFRDPLLMLKSLKGLRGTPLDIFGYSAHRRQERALIAWYRELIEQVMSRTTPDNLAQALEIAALPDQIRGYEKIKEQNIARVKKEAAEKLAALTLQSVSAGT